MRADGPARPFVPLVVGLIMIANVAVFALELRSPDLDRFIDHFALIPYDVVHGIVLPPPSPPLAALTILTAMFVHASVLHIGFNLAFLYGFGPAIEQLCGHLRFALLYLACGIAGGVAQIVAGPGSHVPEIGASGAIAGILGAYLVRFPRAQIIPGVPAMVLILVWAASQFINGFGALSSAAAGAGDGTAYFTHIGGFALGVLAIGFFHRVPTGTRASRW